MRLLRQTQFADRSAEAGVIGVVAVGDDELASSDAKDSVNGSW